MKRLGPQPTDTRLAHLVRRLIDALPWVMARDLRAARADLARVRRLNANLREENYDLRRDFDQLMHGAGIMPTPEYTSIRLDDLGPEPVLILSVEFPRLNAAVALRPNDLRVSRAATEALAMAAERMAHAMVRPMRDCIVQKALGGKTIDQVIKEKLHV